MNSPYGDQLAPGEEPIDDDALLDCLRADVAVEAIHTDLVACGLAMEAEPPAHEFAPVMQEWPENFLA